MSGVGPAGARPALWIGTAGYLFAAVAWGMNIPLTAMLFRTFDPYFLAPLRVGLASLVLLAILFATAGRRALRLGARRRHLALTSFVLAAFYALYTLGLRFTNPITAATVLAGAPVYAAITLRLVTRTPLEPGFWGAALLTLLGASVAIWGRAHETGQGLAIGGGEPLLVLALTCWTLYSIATQRWFEAGSAQLHRTTIALAASALWLALFWAATMAAGGVAPPSRAPDATATTYLLLTGVFSTGLGGVAWNVGVNRIGLAVGSVWQNTVPVFGVLIAMLFGIMPTLEQAIGGAIVLSGVFYLQWRRSAFPRPV